MPIFKKKEKSQAEILTIQAIVDVLAGVLERQTEAMKYMAATVKDSMMATVNLSQSILEEVQKNNTGIRELLEKELTNQMVVLDKIKRFFDEEYRDRAVIRAELKEMKPTLDDLRF